MHIAGIVEILIAAGAAGIILTYIGFIHSWLRREAMQEERAAAKSTAVTATSSGRLEHKFAA
jgi:hypothetical protein